MCKTLSMCLVDRQLRGLWEHLLHQLHVIPLEGRWLFWRQWPFIEQRNSIRASPFSQTWRKSLHHEGGKLESSPWIRNPESQQWKTAKSASLVCICTPRDSHLHWEGIEICLISSLPYCRDWKSRNPSVFLLEIPDISSPHGEEAPLGLCQWDLGVRLYTSPWRYLAPIAEWDIWGGLGQSQADLVKRSSWVAQMVGRAPGMKGKGLARQKTSFALRNMSSDWSLS